ncbi:hypothetical protein H2200_008097 [Cladophialophora chaetospira]|uniref:F-box domain-containing protein n=1 Tax=Cladophialophora chaetospira TaxID=386627 RepID=A0AA38X541_9EURO|nr:hypothetical protein H2200_008097 [Cladophialophora chaetospira]
MQSEMPPPDRTKYPRLTEPIVCGLTASGPLYVVQTDNRRYSLEEPWMLESAVSEEDINDENLSSRINVLPTSSYKNGKARDEIRSGFKSIIWVARGSRYTIVALETNDSVEYLWRTSLRYVLGKKRADRRITTWLYDSTAIEMGDKDDPQIRHRDRHRDRHRLLNIDENYPANEEDNSQEARDPGAETKAPPLIKLAETITKISSPQLETCETDNTCPPRKSPSIHRSVMVAPADKANTTLLDLPPELLDMIFSYLDVDEQEPAQCLPSAWISSWLQWQKPLALTSKKVFNLLADSLHDRTVMSICRQCCLSEIGFSPCDAKCTERWGKLALHKNAPRITYLEIRSEAYVVRATASQVSSVVVKCVNLQELRWPEWFNLSIESDSLPKLSVAWGPVAFFKDDFRSALDQLRSATIEVSVDDKTIPRMPLLEHLRIILGNEKVPVHSFKLDCSNTPEIKTLSVEKVLVHIPADINLMLTKTTSLQSLQLRHCWDNRSLFRSLPWTLESLELERCLYLKEDGELDIEPVDLPSLKIVKASDDQEKHLLRNVRVPDACLFEWATSIF